MARRRLLRAIVVSPGRAKSDPVPVFITYKFMNHGVGLLKSRIHTLFIFVAIMAVGAMLWLAPASAAQNSGFRNAPASAAETKNPYTSTSAAAAGKKLYAQNCAQCHGSNLRGIGPAPALDSTSVKAAKPGELFWFITKGKLESGMPSWASLPQQERWQIVTFLQSQSKTKATAQ